MTWNWEKPDWPHFSWDKKRLAKSEEQFLLATGIFTGVVKHLEADDRDQLTVDAMSTEALTTSEIEGEILDRASVQSSIRKELGLATDKRKAKPSEQGIAEMMVDLYRRFPTRSRTGYYSPGTACWFRAATISKMSAVTVPATNQCKLSRVRCMRRAYTMRRHPQRQCREK